MKLGTNRKNYSLGGMNALGLIQVLLVCFLAGIVQAQASDVSPDPAPVGRMIDIGNRRLHLACSGRGGPTVILIHGTGAFSFDWALVQPHITTTRICSYDRAGHAWSDPVPAAQTYRQMADDLHQLLHRSGDKGPFVLVGHSAGGGLVRVFAATYPKDVAGAVLVETGHPDSLEIINGKLVRVRTLSDLAPPGLSSGKAPVPVRPSGPARIESPFDKLPPDAQRLRLWCQVEGKLPPSSAQAEVDSLSQLRAAHARGDKLFGEKPLLIISRASGGYRPIRGIISEEQVVQLEQERVEHNADLLHLSRNSKAVIATKSGHDVHIDQPEVVIQAIEDVSAAVNLHTR
jgi:pimeloyl-ACP methyl ester carboxylesterase